MSTPPPPPPAPGGQPQWQPSGATPQSVATQYPQPGQPQQPTDAQQPGYPQQGWQQAPVTVERTSSPLAWIALLGAIACAIGSVLVWAKVTLDGDTIAEIKGLGEEGDSKDGAITLPLAIIAGILLVLGATLKRKVFHIIAAVLAGLAALIAFIDIADIENNTLSSTDTSTGFEVEIGIGLWLSAAGAVVATICAIIAAIQTRTRTTGITH